MNSLKFVDILSVADGLKDKVRHWRNKKEINRFMLTRHYISQKEHFKWMESLGEKDNRKFWVVFVEDVPIGSVYLQNIDYNQLSSEWGFYIAEDAYRSKGLGKRIVYKLLEYFFDVMKFNVLITKVFADNIAALNLYRKLGFREVDEPTVNNGRELITMTFSRGNRAACKKEFVNACLRKRQ